ncbi:MAG: recombination-associated protein RdgC [Pseudomonadales bacterium]
MFRNLRLYRVHSPWPDSEEDLAARLADAAFKPCGPFTERSSGFEPPTGEEEGLLARRVGGADLLRLRSQVRLLPPAAVTEALEERVVAFRNRTRREPGRRERRDLKEEVYGELLPKALVKSERVPGFCLLKEELLAVDAASETRAERFLEQLRNAFGSLEVTPLAFKQPLGELLQRMFLGQPPGGFAVGRECRMQDPAAGSAVVTWSDIDLDEPSVQRHVRDGLKVTRLGIRFDDVLSCVLDADGTIRKLKLHGMDAAEDSVGEDEDPLARLDAEFVLITGSVRRLLRGLGGALGGIA